MNKFIDISGERFGKLIAIKRIGSDKHRNSKWLCKCDCGNTKSTTVKCLHSGKTKSCGCIKTQNLLEKRFGKLTVVERLGNDKHGKSLWKCKCECGNFWEGVGSSLIKGSTTSCGCVRRKLASKRAIKDLIGQKFGRLTVISKMGSNKNRQVVWKCRCDCGKMHDVVGSCLIRGDTISCGCYNRKMASERTLRNLLGQKFGRLLVIKRIRNSKRGNARWKCRCDCGKICDIVGSYLIRGETRSCGCIKEEMIGAKNPNWQGGISFEPYCQVWTDKEYKEYIFERDGYQCLNPMCSKISTKLCRHHIDYDKKNCRPENIITVCVSCNFIANSNREWHTSWYRAILSKRYDYNY